MPIQDADGKYTGVIGMQFEKNDYFDLIPSAVFEKKYSVSMIVLYDKDLNLIWSFGCTHKACAQDITKAATLI